MSVDTVMNEMVGAAAPGEAGLTLPEGVELRRVGGRLTLMADGMELAEDFREMLPRLRPDRLGRELLVKAVRVRGVEEIRVFDATAGLGEDSMLLAAAGFSVTMCEGDPVIAALLADGLRRAADDLELSGIVGRMSLVEGDSIEILPSLTEAPDVVYLDPMFPARTKSAAVKKKFQLLHRLESPCADEASLMDAALAAHPRKIVVKRPIKAPVLAGVRPSHSISGKAVRYDVIVPA
nr:class I SAM-dependent methyltransferase [uncultured Parolsenella sp.]